MNLTDDGNFYFPANNGQFISERQRRVNEILQDYDPTLELQWIPPNNRNDKDEPFRVVHYPKNKPAYLVCTANEADERLLANVFEADQKQKGNMLRWIDNYNSALQIYKAKAAEEKRNEDLAFAESVFKSRKSSYMHRGMNFERPGRI